MAVNIYELANLGEVKKILEASDTKDAQGNWIKNPFIVQGYRIQEAGTLGINKQVNYLYIKASDEFFEKNEKVLLDAGAKKLEGTEKADVQKKFEAAEEDSIAGMGSIFGD